MSNNTNKKTSLAAAFKNNLRAWKILFKPCKGTFVSIFLSALTAAASPLVTIWFSAQLLNELAGSRNPAALRNLVLLTLGATAGANAAQCDFAALARSGGIHFFCQDAVRIRQKKA